VQHDLQLVRIEKSMWPTKPKRSRSGEGQQADRVVAPTSVNGSTSSGIAVAPGPLADHDVDTEVLHARE